MNSYAREEFGSWAVKQCISTRVKVLKEESASPVVWEGPCKVVSGEWVDRWTNESLGKPELIEIDHTVPLVNAWRSGAWAWSDSKRRAFLNDLSKDHLVVTSADTNGKKGGRGPEEWKPDDEATWCEYARAWARIKHQWKLTVTHAEWRALKKMAGTC